MDCGDLKQLLMDMALDEVGAEGRKQVQAHVAHCEPCRRELAAWNTTRKLLVQGLPQEEPAQRLAFVASHASAGWRAWLWQRAFTVPVGVAAGVALLAGVLALAGTRFGVQPDGRWELAFGRPQVSAPVATAPAGSKPASFSREQVAEIVAAAIRQSEQRQRADTAAFLETALARFDQRQRAALENVDGHLRYFERTQNFLYKQNEGTTYALQAIAQRLPEQKEGRP